jgi:hypothetical protein
MQHPFLLYVPQSPGDVKECQERLEKDMRTLGTVACVKVGMRRGGGIGHSAFVTDAMQQYGEVYEDIFRFVSEVCDGQEPCTIEGFKVSQHEAYKLERSSRKCSNGCCCASLKCLSNVQLISYMSGLYYVIRTCQAVDVILCSSSFPSSSFFSASSSYSSSYPSSSSSSASSSSPEKI